MARKIDPTSIPKEWKYDLLDKFAVRCSGHTPSQSFPEYWDGGIKWISLADSNRLDKGYIFNTSKEISEEGIKNSSAVLLPAETVVLSRDAGIGKSAVMYEPMAVSQHFIAWKCDNSHKINSWFLYNWLQLNKTEFERQAVGSTIKTIGLPYFKKLKIALPPYQEQEKIAQILSTWDQAISATEKLLENSQQQKKALMQQLLTGKKRLLDENGVTFSEEWQLGHLVDIAKVSKGKALSSKDLEIGNYPVIAGGKTSPYTHSEYTHENVITVSASGAYAGYVAFYPYKIWASDCSVVSNKIGSDVNFIYHLLVSMQTIIYSLQSGGAQPHIYPKDIEGLKILIPPLVEQKKIASVISLADQEIRTLQKKLDCLKQEKKALMQQLLTGKKRVKVAA
ncbi:restriction endonuclease subunit S [Acinetobacter baumannii]|uniref:restriction endonuclease subunit S n=1 Tax=Acinetobacter calcoaceticus/baumannii complex TaxID=909768 RepID=UPI00044929AD|nr:MULTISPECIES: restriction endonuclease subunit S [Acinetobacter calcoaceticus/baumannii complex]KCY50685.1 type I restriction modification DNA specificity domain protein [Acinetobacter baumannii 1571545]EXB17154.1 type I restriction modification DNA specificity domain protein [Acinetobacter baumannii 1429530]MBR7688882.1 restriction endonuclease subunit S [Acinetobacter nosocomialis]MCG9290592.1 restriction endonuclease subunit S [Acinetobacter nosocomialis]MDC4142971.1 restriction endonucl